MVQYREPSEVRKAMRAAQNELSAVLIAEKGPERSFASSPGLNPYGCCATSGPGRGKAFAPKRDHIGPQCQAVNIHELRNPVPFGNPSATALAPHTNH